MFLGQDLGLADVAGFVEVVRPTGHRLLVLLRQLDELRLRYALPSGAGDDLLQRTGAMNFHRPFFSDHSPGRASSIGDATA